MFRGLRASGLTELSHAALALFSLTKRTVILFCVDTGHSSVPMNLCPTLESCLGIPEKQRDNSVTPSPKVVQPQVLVGPGAPESWPQSYLCLNKCPDMCASPVSQFPNLSITFHQPNRVKVLSWSLKVKLPSNSQGMKHGTPET